MLGRKEKRFKAEAPTVRPLLPLLSGPLYFGNARFFRGNRVERSLMVANGENQMWLGQELFSTTPEEEKGEIPGVSRSPGSNDGKQQTCRSRERGRKKEVL